MRRLAMRAATALGLLLLLGAACAAEDYPVLVYPCPRAGQPPVIDGLLDESAWREASLVSGFTYYNRPELAPVQTSFRVLYDAGALYFGVFCHEPAAARISPSRSPRDSTDVFRQESIELFLDPCHDHAHYFQFAVSAGGWLYDAERTNPMWNSAAQTAARLADDAWSLEIAIPWQDLGIEPRPALVMGFNLCRNRHLGLDRQWTCWSQVDANFHDPLRFAHLVLSASPGQIGGLADEFRKGGRTGPLRIFSAEGFTGATYRALAQAALADVDSLIESARAVAAAESPEVAAEIRTRLGPLRDRAAQLRRRIESGAPDAVAWAAVDQESAALRRDLRDLLWQARLAALLASI